MEVRSLIKNYLFVLSSQLLGMVLNIVLLLLLPKFFSVANFGYWQLFLFFSSYAGFFHFGLNDGIYLRYGGKRYDKINKSLVKGQFYLLFAFQLVLVCIGLLIFSLTDHTENYSFVIYASLFYLVISNLLSFITIALQAINRLKEFSLIMIILNLLLVIFFSVLLLKKNFDYKPYVIAYNFAYILGLILCFYTIKDILKAPILKNSFSVIWKETLKSTTAGSKLLLSNISGMLIVGIGRFLIERKWGIEEFGKVSLAITLTTFFTFFIRQASLVLFPALKNTSVQQKKILFQNGLQWLNIFMLGTLLFFPLIEFLIQIWIPKYSSNIPFLILFLPICIFEGKMQVILNTYMKVERMETQLMKINIIFMIFSLILSLIGFYLQSILFIIAALPFSVMIKCFYMEWVMKKKYHLLDFHEELEVVLLSLLFVCTYFYFDHKTAFFCYFCGYLIYLFFNRSVLNDVLRRIKQIRL